MIKKISFFLFVLFVVCISTNVKADNFFNERGSAKQFAVEWITGTNTKGTSSDIIKIVEAAFAQGIKHKIDPFLILALINKESTFNKKAKNKSKASGLMQVIPYWHRDKINGRNIFSVDVNIEVGTQVLKDCLDKHSQKIDRALRCYSGGASKVYNREVMSTRNKLRRWVIEQQFDTQVPIYYAATASDVMLF